MNNTSTALTKELKSRNKVVDANGKVVTLEEISTLGKRKQKAAILQMIVKCQKSLLDYHDEDIELMSDRKVAVKKRDATPEGALVLKMSKRRSDLKMLKVLARNELKTIADMAEQIGFNIDKDIQKILEIEAHDE